MLDSEALLREFCRQMSDLLLGPPLQLPGSHPCPLHVTLSPWSSTLSLGLVLSVDCPWEAKLSPQKQTGPGEGRVAACLLLLRFHSSQVTFVP